MKKWVFAGWIATLAVSGSKGLAEEPGWASEVVAPPPVRAHIEATPITERPYRPFHFYGNTKRRLYYRGSAIPLPSDLRNGSRALTRRPYAPVDSMLPSQDGG